MYVILTSCVDAGDEGGYDGNVIGSFVSLVNAELTEEEVWEHARTMAERDPDEEVHVRITVQKHPHDRSYQYMATLSFFEDEDEEYGYDVFYHYKIPHL